MNATPDPTNFYARRDTALEFHFTVHEVGKSLQLSPDKVTELFRDEPGVVKVGRPGTRTRRARYTLRIPQSVITRVLKRISVT